MDTSRVALRAARRATQFPANLSRSCHEVYRSEFQLRTSKIEGRIASKKEEPFGRDVMSLLRKLGLATTACLLWANSAAADTTVKWLHIEANPAQVKIWEEVARAYEASHPGVKVEMQF